jgi:monoterpene epsilon-lactone hydrolase
MSFQSRLGCWYIRLTMKRKPPGEPALVDFTRRRFEPPGWIIALHSSGMDIRRVDEPVKGEWIVPDSASENESVVYYLHGGGYISGSAKTNRPVTIPLARRLKRKVFSLDYRLAPEHHFPAGLDDAVTGYRWLLSNGINPENISVAGDSAGGGMTLALAMRLRNGGEPLPACLVCLSPWTDMTGSGDSITANSERDSMFVAEDIGRYASAYLGTGSRRHDPLASPLLGDFGGLPPLYLEVGENEVLLDDARRVHEKALAAGLTSQLRIVRGVPHGWQFGAPFLPEAKESFEEIARFITRSGGLSRARGTV